MILCPVVGYVDQYKSMANSGSIQGFSPKVCAVLLASNVLRIFFWTCKRFDTTLLYQSIVMIFAMIVLLELCVRLQRKSKPYVPFNIDSLVDNFWEWSDFTAYLWVLGLLVTTAFLLTAIFIDVPLYVELLGLLSLSIEAFVPYPQLRTIMKTKSSQGFSLLVLGTWFIGDSFKTFYFIYEKSPIQFILCGAVQLSIDCLILIFMFKYEGAAGLLPVPTSSHDGKQSSSPDQARN